MTEALAPTDLLGQWVLERTVHDRLADLRGTVTGTTELTTVDDDTCAGTRPARWSSATARPRCGGR